jgi:surface protein
LYSWNKKDELPVDLQKIPIGDWDVSRVTNMRAIFSESRNFNESLNNWDVSNVTDMEYMFRNCHKFNQPLDKWGDKLGKVTNMSHMFVHCEHFNQPLDNWNVRNVTNMNCMFLMCEKFNQSLDNWNVSNVTNMSDMFVNCEKFNQPLNNWNVSNVTDMSEMFGNCINFNQPLDNWNVRNVTDMRWMFNKCAKFNQRINNWNVRNVVEYEEMFDKCNIEEQNKPRFINVDARQIHTETGKINFENLNSFLKGILNNKRIPGYINYSEYIEKTISKLIHDGDESEEIKNEQREGLQRIMSERLNELNYQDQSPLIRESIFYVLEYVKKQSSIFKNMYVASFIKDCVHAYEGPDGMTCALGALERILFSFVPACAAEETEDCKEITGIIEADPNKLISEYIVDWYKEHKTGTSSAFPSGTTNDEFKQSLQEYLLRKMPRNQFPDIENLIKQKVDETSEYVGFEPDDFMRGGKKRKMKKKKTKKRTKRVIKTKKTNKKVKKKVRKTNKKNKKVKKHTHRQQINMRK